MFELIFFTVFSANAEVGKVVVFIEVTVILNVVTM